MREWLLADRQIRWRFQSIGLEAPGLLRPFKLRYSWHRARECRARGFRPLTRLACGCGFAELWRGPSLNSVTPEPCWTTIASLPAWSLRWWQAQTEDVLRTLERRAVQAMLVAGQRPRLVARGLRISIRTVWRIAKQPAVTSRHDRAARTASRGGARHRAAPDLADRGARPAAATMQKYSRSGPP